MNRTQIVTTTLHIIKPFTSVHKYATVQQRDKIHQYPYFICRIVFYQYNRFMDGIKEIGEINAGMYDYSYFFTFQHKELKKIPVHRKTSGIKLDEQFSFIDHTLYVNTDCIGFKGPMYTKEICIPDQAEQDTDKINFILRQHFSWNMGKHSTDMWHDQLDYMRLAQKSIHQYELHNCDCSFISIHKAKSCQLAWENIADDLTKRLKWWRDATVEELIKGYNEYMVAINRPNEQI